MSNSAVLRSIATPLPDLEIGLPRVPLDYAMVLPENGMTSDTGLLLYAPPFGSQIRDTYIIDILLPRLANRYNCIAVAVGYFGIKIKHIVSDVLIPSQALTDLAIAELGPEAASWSLDQKSAGLFEAGYRDLPDDCVVLLNCLPEYQSFGLLPAFDMVAVLADMLHSFPIRRDRLHAFGSSYGGYIVSLLLKFLPHSFHVVIENSGFSKACVDQMASMELGGYVPINLKGLNVKMIEVSPWQSNDPSSSRFISPSVLGIRDCSISEHFEKTETILHSYHSVGDKIVPIAEKQQMWDALDGKMDLRTTTVTRGMIDGRLYKTIEHGMEASLLGLFDDAMSTMAFAGRNAHSDFDRGTERVLKAANSTYELNLNPDLSIEVGLQR